MVGGRTGAARGPEAERDAEAELEQEGGSGERQRPRQRRAQHPGDRAVVGEGIAPVAPRGGREEVDEALRRGAVEAVDRAQALALRGGYARIFKGHGGVAGQRLEQGEGGGEDDEQQGEGGGRAPEDRRRHRASRAALARAATSAPD